MWQKALEENREIITLGDVNIDSLVWDKPPTLQTPYDKKKHPLYLELREKILTTGTTKLNTEYTRVDNQPGGRISCLDHVYTNMPQKISSFTTHHNTFSDHSMVEVNKNVKNKITNKKYIKIRSLKNYRPAQFVENVKNHYKYIETMHEVDTNTIARNITQIMQESVSDMAPIRRIQLSAKNVHPISEEAKLALAERDHALAVARHFPSADNVRNHKHM